MRSLCALLPIVCAAAFAQQPPQATELPGKPFFIKNAWVVGGKGNWDYLTLDTTAHRLYIAHGTEVQVVDVETGALAGQITGLHEAHDIALDAAGEYGYISDGLANEVKVFDRRTLQVVARIPTGPAPRALVLDAQTGLLFVVCMNPLGGGPEQTGQGQSGPSQNGQAPLAGSQTMQSQARRPNGARTSPQTPPWRSAREGEVKTSISVIDPSARKRVGEILMPGKLGYAQSDGNGQVFVLVVDRDQVARLDAGVIEGLLRRPAESAAPAAAGSAEAGPNATAGADSSASASGGGSAESSQSGQVAAAGNGQGQAKTSGDADTPVELDWSHENHTDAGQESMRILRLGPACQEPRSFAVDGTHERLFAACDNMKLEVMNAASGETVTSLPIGPGTDAVGYDAGRGLIYTANGGAQGTLTIIRQDVTDTYAEIQNLATRQRARTLAVNPDTGQVYLVTDYEGVNLRKQGGIGTLKTVPVEGSFQVLVIGN